MSAAFNVHDDYTLYSDFEAFALKLAAEVRVHGKANMTPHDVWKMMAFGFKSPSGTFLVKVNAAKAYAERFQDAPVTRSAGPVPGSVVIGRRVPDKVVVEAVRRRLARAWDGDPASVN